MKNVFKISGDIFKLEENPVSFNIKYEFSICPDCSCELEDLMGPNLNCDECAKLKGPDPESLKTVKDILDGLRNS